MTRAQFEEQIEAELTSLRGVIVEIDALLRDADRAEGITPLRASTLAGAFIQQFYNGLETVLKQTASFAGLPLPEGDHFHADLLALFGPDAPPDTPLRFDAELFSDLDPFRKFRHVFRTSYSAHLDWTKLYPGARTARSVFDRFEVVVRDALLSTPDPD